MSDINTEQLWKVLRAEVSLPDALRLMGAPEERIAEIMQSIYIADRHDSFEYFTTGIIMRRAAYKKLVELNEIKPDEIFSLAKGDRPPLLYDMGLKGGKLFIYTETGWTEQ